MKVTKWLLAGGLALSGLVLANQDEVKKDDADNSVQQTQNEVKQKSEKAKEKAKEKVGDASEKAASGAQSAGTAVSQSLREAGRSVEGQRSLLPMGTTNKGDVKNTVTTDAVGLISGRGLNATLSRSVSPKWSAVGGLNYARTATPIGAVTAFGIRAGADYFIIGEHNEGLRIGPRVDLGFGTNTVGGSSGFAGVGAAGEIGYNWISSRGLTAGAGLGMRAGFGGGGTTPLGNGIGQGNVGPYLNLNVGYSW